MKNLNGQLILEETPGEEEEIKSITPKITFAQQTAVLRGLKSKVNHIKKIANKIGRRYLLAHLFSSSIFILSLNFYIKEPGETGELISNPNLKTFLLYLLLISGFGTLLTGCLCLYYFRFMCCISRDTIGLGQNDFVDAMRRAPEFSEIKLESSSIASKNKMVIKNPDNLYCLEVALNDSEKKIEMTKMQRLAFFMGSRKDAPLNYFFQELGPAGRNSDAANIILNQIFDYAEMSGVKLGK